MIALARREPHPPLVDNQPEDRSRMFGDRPGVLAGLYPEDMSPDDFPEDDIRRTAIALSLVDWGFRVARLNHEGGLVEMPTDQEWTRKRRPRLLSLGRVDSWLRDGLRPVLPQCLDRIVVSIQQNILREGEFDKWCYHRPADGTKRRTYYEFPLLVLEMDSRPLRRPLGISSSFPRDVFTSCGRARLPVIFTKRTLTPKQLLRVLSLDHLGDWFYPESHSRDLSFLGIDCDMEAVCTRRFPRLRPHQKITVQQVLIAVFKKLAVIMDNVSHFWLRLTGNIEPLALKAALEEYGHLGTLSNELLCGVHNRNCDHHLFRFGQEYYTIVEHIDDQGKVEAIIIQRREPDQQAMKSIFSLQDLAESRYVPASPTSSGSGARSDDSRDESDLVEVFPFPWFAAHRREVGRAGPVIIRRLDNEEHNRDMVKLENTVKATKPGAPSRPTSLSLRSSMVPPSPLGTPLMSPMSIDEPSPLEYKMRYQSLRQKASELKKMEKEMERMMKQSEDKQEADDVIQEMNNVTKKADDVMVEKKGEKDMTTKQMADVNGNPEEETDHEYVFITPTAMEPPMQEDIDEGGYLIPKAKDLVGNSAIGEAEEDGGYLVPKAKDFDNVELIDRPEEESGYLVPMSKEVLGKGAILTEQIGEMDGYLMPNSKDPKEDQNVARDKADEEGPEGRHRLVLMPAARKPQIGREAGMETLARLASRLYEMEINKEEEDETKEDEKRCLWESKHDRRWIGRVDKVRLSHRNLLLWDMVPPGLEEMKEPQVHDTRTERLRKNMRSSRYVRSPNMDKELNGGPQTNFVSKRIELLIQPIRRITICQFALPPPAVHRLLGRIETWPTTELVQLEMGSVFGCPHDVSLYQAFPANLLQIFPYAAIHIKRVFTIERLCVFLEQHERSSDHFGNFLYLAGAARLTSYLTVEAEREEREHNNNNKKEPSRRRDNNNQTRKTQDPTSEALQKEGSAPKKDNQGVPIHTVCPVHNCPVQEVAPVPITRNIKEEPEETREDADAVRVIAGIVRNLSRLDHHLSYMSFELRGLRCPKVLDRTLRLLDQEQLGIGDISRSFTMQRPPGMRWQELKEFVVVSKFCLNKGTAQYEVKLNQGKTSHWVTVKRSKEDADLVRYLETNTTPSPKTERKTAKKDDIRETEM